MYVSPSLLCFWLSWGIQRKSWGIAAHKKGRERKGGAALSSNHQLNHKFGSLEMSCIIDGASTFKADYRDFFFFWYKARQFFADAAKWNNPFLGKSLRAIYTLLYVMCCLSSTWAPFSRIYLTDTHSQMFSCNLFGHFPSVFMNTLKSYSFFFTSFCFGGLIMLLLKIFLNQRRYAEL